MSYRRLQLLTGIHSDLQVTIQQGNVQHLMAAIDAGIPPAVFVITRELPYWPETVYHSIVLVGYTETEFSIHDPAFDYAPQIASIGDLDLAWLDNDSFFATVQRNSRRS